MVTVTSLYICISYIYTYSYKILLLIIFTFLLHVNLFRYMFYVYVISSIYTFTVFLYLYLHIPYSFYNLLFFISYHYFSDYMNFYHTFHISLRSVELILYYHIIYCHGFSHILSCAFIYYSFHLHFLYDLVLSYTLHLCFHSYYRIGIHDRFEREPRLVCHSVAM